MTVIIKTEIAFENYDDKLYDEATLHVKTEVTYSTGEKWIVMREKKHIYLYIYIHN
jgi:hypothetical protein